MISYVLVTPARNEAAYIERTIQSVIAQRLKPLRWVIVNDGSTDGTDEIADRHAVRHPWIELVRIGQRTERDFAGKVKAFNAGHARLTGLHYDVIGCLDADISFDEGYFEFILSKFADDERLGVAGTPFQEDGRQYDYRFTSIEHVSGACQMFRKACFESIGGYRPVAGGGIDWIAVTTARMNGWKTRTFVDKVCHHHRPIGTAQNSESAARFRQGKKDYALGGHPLWEVFRSLYQMKSKPLVLGGICLMSGYTWAWLSRCERSASPDLVKFHRQEQLSRLRHVLRLQRRPRVGSSQ